MVVEYSPGFKRVITVLNYVKIEFGRFKSTVESLKLIV